MRGMSVASSPEADDVRHDDMILPTPDRVFDWRATPRPARRSSAVRSSRMRRTSSPRALAARVAATAGDRRRPWARGRAGDRRRRRSHSSRLRQVHGAASSCARREPPARRCRPRPTSSSSDDPATGARGSDGRLRAAADRRSADRRGRRGACRLARAGAARAAVAASSALAEQFGSRPDDLVVADRAVDRRRAATRSATRCAQRFDARASSGAARTLVSRATRADCRESVDAGAARRRAREPLVLRRLGRPRAISCESAGVPADQIFVADLCTASHPRSVLLVPARRHAGRPDGGGRSGVALRPSPRWRADRRGR